jgi:hypothetical protein
MERLGKRGVRIRSGTARTGAARTSRGNRVRNDGPRRGPDNRTVRRSVYALLIQPNLRPNARYPGGEAVHEQVLRDRLARVVSAWASDTRNFVRSIRFRDGWVNYPPGPLTAEQRLDAEVAEFEANVPDESFSLVGHAERGSNPRGGAVHMHPVLRIAHTTNFWLDQALLKPLLIELWNADLREHGGVAGFDREIAGLLVRVRRYVDFNDLVDYAYKEAADQTVQQIQELDDF